VALFVGSPAASFTGWGAPDSHKWSAQLMVSASGTLSNLTTWIPEVKYVNRQIERGSGTGSSKVVGLAGSRRVLLEQRLGHVPSGRASPFQRLFQDLKG
jgi:hypothetical protein